MVARGTEAVHPQAAGIQTLPPDMVMDRLFDSQVKSMDAVCAAIPALCDAARLVAEKLHVGGRLVYAGAGSAGLMALADCLELAGTFGIAPERTLMLFPGGAAGLIRMRGDVEDDPTLARADLAQVGLTAADVVIAVSASGGTPYTLAIVQGARDAGALVIGIANNADVPLLGQADVPVLLDTGPELVAGSTRMAAGTAQKIALNMLSTMAGLHLGHIHDGRMVNLQADNAKLMARAAQMIADLAGVDTGAAQTALAAAGGHVKAAILIASGAAPERAEMLLVETQGHLGPALERCVRQQT